MECLTPEGAGYNGMEYTIPDFSSLQLSANGSQLLVAGSVTALTSSWDKRANFERDRWRMQQRVVDQAVMDSLLHAFAMLFVHRAGDVHFDAKIIQPRGTFCFFREHANHG